jgi:putative hydrolase of the HAD superfamily
MVPAGSPVSHTIRPFDAIFFDLGNTLVYFDGEWAEVLLRASRKLWLSLHEAGLKLNNDLFYREFFERLHEYYIERENDHTELTTANLLRILLAEKGYPNIPQSTIRHALTAMYSISQEHWHVEKDTRPVLADLKRQSYKLGIISNAGDDEDIQRLVDKAEIRPYLDLIVSSAAVGIRKPNPRIFEWALSRMNVNHTRAAMVGDNLDADIQGARNAKLFSIFLTRRADTPAYQDQVDSIKPDAVIHTLSELPDLLNSCLLAKMLTDRNVKTG